MREQKMRIGMTLTVLIVGVITVMARSVVEVSQTPTADELAEMTSIRPVPGKNGLYVIPGYDGGTTVSYTHLTLPTILLV